MRQSLLIISAFFAFIIFSGSTPVKSQKELSKCPYIQQLHETPQTGKCPYLQNRKKAEESSMEKQSKCPYLEKLHKTKDTPPVKANKLKSA